MSRPSNVRELIEALTNVLIDHDIEISDEIHDKITEIAHLAAEEEIFKDVDEDWPWDGTDEQGYIDTDEEEDQ